MATSTFTEAERVFLSAPFIQDMGLTVQSLSAGECTSLLQVQARHLQQDGLVHAGVQATMADHTAGTAAATLLTEGQQVLSVEFKINLLRAAKGSQMRCHAKVLKAGATLIVAEAEVWCGNTDHDLNMVSKTTVTLMVLAIRH